MVKKLRYTFEYVSLSALFILFRALPLDAASGIGGWIGRHVGPRLAASRKAMANLRAAFPERDEAFYKSTISGMWDNLGRVIAEYPHLPEIARRRTEIVHDDILKTLRDDGKPAVLFSGHLGNWETSAGAFSQLYDFTVDLIYRAPNNPGVARLLDRARSLEGKIPTIPKSRAGARRMIEALREGRHLAILIDQKFNQGLAVPLFGRPAMTSPSFAQLAQKFDCPLVPVRFERLSGAHFRLTIFPPMTLFEASGAPKPVESLIAQAHGLLESWISEKPEQWLWLHRRWDSAALKGQENTEDESEIPEDA